MARVTVKPYWLGSHSTRMSRGRPDRLAATVHDSRIEGRREVHGLVDDRRAPVGHRDLGPRFYPPRAGVHSCTARPGRPRAGWPHWVDRESETGRVTIGADLRPESMIGRGPSSCSDEVHVTGLTEGS